MSGRKRRDSQCCACKSKVGDRNRDLLSHLIGARDALLVRINSKNGTYI
jgi:hypothetical protein